jgi:hypothetical protein
MSTRRASVCAGIHAQVSNQPAHSAVLDDASIERRRAPANRFVARSTPTAQKIQPTGFRGRRATISAPTSGYATATNPSWR